MSTTTQPMANGHGNTLATNDLPPEVLEAVVVGGDLSKLSPQQRLSWYKARCDAAGLDPRSQPFQYLLLQGKLVLYATKSATDGLIANRKLTVEIVERRADPNLGIYESRCRATFPDGHHVEDVGAVTIGGLKGDQLCNAVMKAVTKSKRRTVLSACGLGMLDESEVETIAGARHVEEAEIEVAVARERNRQPSQPALPRREQPALTQSRKPLPPEVEIEADATDAVESWPMFVAKAAAAERRSWLEEMVAAKVPEVDRIKHDNNVPGADEITLSLVSEAVDKGKLAEAKVLDAEGNYDIGKCNAAVAAWWKKDPARIGHKVHEMYANAKADLRGQLRMIDVDGGEVPNDLETSEAGSRG